MLISKLVFAAACWLAWAPSSSALDCAPPIMAGEFLAAFFAGTDHSHYAIGDGFMAPFHQRHCKPPQDRMYEDGRVVSIAACEAMSSFSGALMRSGTPLQSIKVQPVMIYFDMVDGAAPNLGTARDTQIFLLTDFDEGYLITRRQDICPPPWDAQSAPIIRECLQNAGCTPAQTRILNENSLW